MLTGDNGILTQATKTKENTTKAEEEEKVKLAVMASSISDDGFTETIEGTTFKDELKNEFGSQDIDVLENVDSSFLITITDTNRKYYVDSDKTVINSDNIVEISDANELKDFRDDVNSGNSYEGKVVLLTNDITLNANEEWQPIGLYPIENTSPLDETNKPFSGIFDGGNHEINSLYINTTDKVQGLFGLVINGVVKNVGIGESNNITGGLSTGAVVGYLYNSKAINCYNKADIKVGSYSGGVIGQANNGDIENCYNKGNITSKNATSLTGGICGSLVNNSKISKCYNIGNINCEGVNNVGGLMGQAVQSVVENCFNSGNVVGNRTVGGVVGQIYSYSLLQNCYNTGNVDGDYRIGGIAGMNSSEICNCYNVGNISGNEEFGGIVGLNTISETNESIGVIKNVYSLESIYGINKSTIEQGEVKNSEELKLLAPTLGEAFEEDSNNINNGYPVLKWKIK